MCVFLVSFFIHKQSLSASSWLYVELCFPLTVTRITPSCDTESDPEAQFYTHTHTDKLLTRAHANRLTVITLTPSEEMTGKCHSRNWRASDTFTVVQRGEERRRGLLSVRGGGDESSLQGTVCLFMYSLIYLKRAALWISFCAVIHSRKVKARSPDNLHNEHPHLRERSINNPLNRLFIWFRLICYCVKHCATILLKVWGQRQTWRGGRRKEHKSRRERRDVRHPGVCLEEAESKILFRDSQGTFLPFQKCGSFFSFVTLFLVYYRLLSPDSHSFSYPSPSLSPSSWLPLCHVD